MYHRIVMTAGISLLTKRKEQLDDKFNLFSIPDRMTEENEPFMHEVVEFILEDISQKPFHPGLSAEISMIDVLDKQNKLHKKPIITLFHTDTLKGMIAANVIKEVLTSHYSAFVKMRKIIDVDVGNRVKLSKSLGHFLSGVSNALSEGDPTSTCFAPIGGYKVMTSLGYLVGAFHQYPTAYLHEGSSVLHEIPPVQIQVNEKFIEENHQFLRKLIREGVLEIDHLSKEEKQLIEKEPTFFTKEENLVELNPFGQFLCKQSKYAHYFQPTVFMDADVLQWMKRKYKSNLTYALNEIRDLMIKHQDFLVEHQSTLFHESDFSELNGKDLNGHLYKGGNSPVFRAIWHYDRKKDQYYIGKIWFDHEDYERQAASFVESFDVKNTKWEDITEWVFKPL